MAFWNKYPYTDFHELNADFLLQRLKEIEEYIQGIEADLKAELSAWLKEQLAPYEQTLDELIREVEGLKTETEETLAAYDTKITNFETQVNNQIAAIRQDLINSIASMSDLMDLKIETNNLWLMNEITENVGSLFLVMNPFTGVEVTIQQMVDYLAAFHITDGIDYDTMASRALTYNQFAALNITYTDLALNGNTLYN